MTNYRASWIPGLLAFSGLAVAAESDLSLHLGNTYTDNARLTPDNEQPDNRGGAALKFDFADEGSHYETDLRTALTYIHYFSGTFDDQFLRGFAGDATFAFVPGRLTWMVSENYGPVLEDPLAPDIPQNWSYDSYFTTGPDIQVGDPDGMYSVLSGRYSRSDYENKSVPASQGYLGEFALVFPGTPSSEKSIHVNARRVEQGEGRDPISEPFHGYDLQEAFVRLGLAITRTSFYLEAGGTQMHDQGDASSTPLLRVGLERSLAPRLSLSLDAGTQYSDNLVRFARLQDASDNVNDPRRDVTPVTDPMKEEFVEATFEVKGTRTHAALRLAYNNLAYQHSVSPLAAQKYLDATLEFQRQFTPRWSLEAGGTYAQRDYNDIGRTDDDTFAYLGSIWQLGRELQMTLMGRLQKRQSTDPFSEYTERSLQLEFVYQPITRNAERGTSRLKTRSVK